MSAPSESGPDPRTYFTELFPAQWARTLREQERAVETAQRVLDEMRDVNGTLQVEVRGEGGGRFALNVEGGAMTPSDEAAHAPFLTLVLERPDFEQLAREAGDSPLGFLGALASQGGDLKLTAPRLQNLELITGTLRFELAGAGGFALLAHFGKEPIPAEPTTVIRVDRGAYEALKNGEVAAQDAFLSGLIELEGDMQLAMQLALAVLSPE